MKRETKAGKKNLSRGMEVDVSGQLSVDGNTVFAYSNGESYSILIKSSVKREIKRHYLLFRKTPRRFYFDIYIGGLVALFVQLRKHKGPVYLDWELSGRHGGVRGELLVRLKRRGVETSFLEILPKKVGKKSPAHLLAYAVYSKRKRADRILTAKELFGFLK